MYLQKFDLTGRLALVTGGAQGIGAACADALTEAGARVVIADLDLPAAETKAAALRAAGRQAVAVALDVTDSVAVEDLAEALETEGGVDILINNAGIVPSGTLETLRDEEIAATLAVNVAAPLSLTRDLLGALSASRGQVVNMGSVFGDIGFPYFSAYSASKFGLRGWSDALRRELAPRGIAVTYLAPRATRTDATAGFDRLVGPMAMTLDDPQVVAARAWRAIAARRREQLPASRERLFVTLQRLRPAIIDRALIRLARDPAVIAAARNSSS